MKPRRLAIFGLTAGLLGGGGAGLLMTGTTLASAQEDVTGTVADPAATTDSTAPAPAPRSDWAKAVLDGLVAKGTINQAQADEILAALQAARPAHGPGGKGGRGHGLGKLDARFARSGRAGDLGPR